MKNLLVLLLCLSSLSCFAQSGPAVHEPPNPIPSSYFEGSNSSTIPSWGELTKLIDKSSACSKMARKAPLCGKANDAIVVVLAQTIAQVMRANNAAKRMGYTNVCDAYAEKLIADVQPGPQASYALLLMDAHIKAAKPMYGSAVDGLPLYRILYNAMADEKPCAK